MTTIRTREQETTGARLPLADTPLGRTIAETDTDIWNDSCAVEELEYALSFGAVGATANPTIVVDVWNKDRAFWRDRLRVLAAERPTATVWDLAWAVVEDMSVRGARMLQSVFEAQGGRQGRLSVQTNPLLFRSPAEMVDQAIQFATIAPNIIVKLPATAAGIEAIEEATYRGISVNVTVSVTVAQAVAAAEAIERGLRRRDGEGLPTDRMGPVVTLMMGRIEDWLRVVIDRDGLTVDPAALPWSGVAAFKNAYRLFRERGYRARLLGAAIRHHYHWSELIGGDVVITMPAAWQRRFNASSVEVRPRIDDPIAPAILDELRSKVPEFVRAYEPDGLSVAEFDTFGATARTLRAFVASYQDLLNEVTDALIPNPDKKA